MFFKRTNKQTCNLYSMHIFLEGLLDPRHPSTNMGPTSRVSFNLVCPLLSLIRRTCNGFKTVIEHIWIPGRSAKTKHLKHKERVLQEKKDTGKLQNYNVMKNVSTHSMVNVHDGEFPHTNRLFVCQDENEHEDQSLRLFWIKPLTNEPDFQ